MKSKDSGVKKAAIFLMSLGPEISSQVLKLLPEEMIQKVTYEIAQIEYVDQKEKEKVLDDFADMVSARETLLSGGIDYARTLLTKALGTSRANEILEVLSRIEQTEDKPFAVLRKADTHQLANILINEHPQTIALVMCYVQPDKAADVLSVFPSELQTEVAERIGSINRTSPSIIRKIEATMKSKFFNIGDNADESKTIGGVKKLVEILNAVDRTTEKNILNELSKTQPELAENVKANIFVFEDIVTLDKSSIQRVLREVNHEDLVLALKGASEEVTSTIFANLSKRAQELVHEDMEFTGPVRLKTVEEAQSRIVGIIRRLDDADEIIIERGDSNSIII